MKAANRRRQLTFIAGWLILLIVATPLALKQDRHLTSGGYEVPGSQSYAVEQSVRQAFPSEQTERLSVLLAGETGATRASYLAALRETRQMMSKEADVRLPPESRRLVLAAAERGRPVLLPLAFSASFSETIDLANRIHERLQERGDGAVRVRLVGRTAQGVALQEESKEGLAAAERIGFPIVLLILLTVFGSLAAAALPVALGMMSVTLTGAAIYLLSLALPMSVFVTNIASMIGIGVAVDYALFMLVRYREEIAAGADREAALRTTRRTSGRAVAFSGITVILALATVFAIDNTALRSMALGAMVVVAFSVLLALQLLPVLIALLGARLERRRRLMRVVGSIASRRGAPNGGWTALIRRVMARPVLSVVAAGALLVALALPALSMTVGDDSLRQLPTDNDVRQGAVLAARIQGAGAQAPVLIALKLRGDDSTQAGVSRDVGALTDQLRRDPEVARVLPAVRGDDETLLLAAVPRHDGEHPDVLALVRRLREQTLPTSSLARNSAVTSLAVGGSTANSVDLTDLITSKVAVLIALLLAATYVLLLVLLRSVLLPLKAIVLNLLSVVAAYGVLVMVFQWDVLGPLTDGSVNRIQALTLPLILAVVFGLSMDYEVFLLTRIKERYDALGDNAEAVLLGVAGSARTITSAAVIMVGVFAVFTATSVPTIQQIGLGNAVAIAVDATVTRLVLLPAAMQLMGRWNWWLPGWLDRLLPRWKLDGSPASRSVVPPAPLPSAVKAQATEQSAAGTPR